MVFSSWYKTKTESVRISSPSLPLMEIQKVYGNKKKKNKCFFSIKMQDALTA
jgi:hypothetical protein